MKRNQGSAVLFAILLFCCGAATGALVYRSYVTPSVNAKTAEDFRQRYLSEMKSKLNLRQAQIDQLQVILDETKSQYRAVREQYRPAMLRVKSEQTSRVKAILTPSQIPAYEALVAERERRSKEQDARERKEDQSRELADRARISH